MLWAGVGHIFEGFRYLQLPLHGLRNRPDVLHRPKQKSGGYSDAFRTLFRQFHPNLLAEFGRSCPTDPISDASYPYTGLHFYDILAPAEA